MPREAREVLVKDLLQDAWDQSNTYGLTPNISFGWFDADTLVPDVAVAQASENPAGGGDTGFRGMKPDGSGDGTQYIIGTVPVHVFCRNEELDSASTQNARQFNAAAMDEVQRIIGNNNENPQNPSTNNRPVDSLAYDGRNPAPEPDDVPMVDHYVATVRYTYRDND